MRAEIIKKTTVELVKPCFLSSVFRAARLQNPETPCSTFASGLCSTLTGAFENVKNLVLLSHSRSVFAPLGRRRRSAARTNTSATMWPIGMAQNGGEALCLPRIQRLHDSVKNNAPQIGGALSLVMGLIAYGMPKSRGTFSPVQCRSRLQRSNPLDQFLKGAFHVSSLATR